METTCMELLLTALIVILPAVAIVLFVENRNDPTDILGKLSMRCTSDSEDNNNQKEN